ncbi:tetratricopeptide repeat protein [Roseivirga echinicomitans]|uniref:Tetratricopeptide repeat protein n=1 Tax=Roseivirga echinicomitans TaxID=296218 RepID=A0A150XLQ5_9BACT|nr:hypothetical protein [Roseivirga echinicomitans]KYG79641.1 hypothetical protein AWN68_17715 [Roseivirga echinicomitans]
MSIVDKYIEFFDAYDRNELSQKEVQAFKERIINDEKFRVAYEEYSKQVNLLKALGARDQMRSIMDKEEKRKVLKLKIFIPLGIAASFLLLMFIFTERKIDNQQLFETYFEPFPNLISSREKVSLLDGGLRAYSNSDYENALKIFRTLSNASDTLYFYQGMSHVSLKRAEEAIDSFDHIGPESYFYLPSVWYKGLSYLLINETDSAAFYIQKADSSGYGDEELHELLNSLK